MSDIINVTRCPGDNVTDAGNSYISLEKDRIPDIGVEGESPTVKNDKSLLTCYWLRHNDKCLIRPNKEKRLLPCLYQMDLRRCQDFDAI